MHMYHDGYCVLTVCCVIVLHYYIGLKYPVYSSYSIRTARKLTYLHASQEHIPHEYGGVSVLK
jgi:hypothetical protein